MEARVPPVESSPTVQQKLGTTVSVPNDQDDHNDPEHRHKISFLREARAVLKEAKGALYALAAVIAAVEDVITTIVTK